VNGDGRQDAGSGNTDQRDLHQYVGHRAAKDQLRDNTRKKQQEGAVCHHLETGEQRFFCRSQGIPLRPHSVKLAGAKASSSSSHTLRDIGHNAFGRRKFPTERKLFRV
jgi:hypothetical protein